MELGRTQPNVNWLCYNFETPYPFSNPHSIRLCYKLTIKALTYEKQHPVYNKYKKNLRVERKSSLNNIDSVVVLGLKPSIITLPDCFVNLHLP